ncbi:hypothetical protein ABZ671_28955 [Micromonospora sp. NPDC006766]|uniref:hypothetical protein n=1 Tax=Micromonospora sp. NPDC006766 TaxID=3154778 RepID=UPI0033E095D5
MTVISNVVEPGATPPAPLSAPTELIERARAVAPGLVAWQRDDGGIQLICGEAAQLAWRGGAER